MSLPGYEKLELAGVLDATTAQLVQLVLDAVKSGKKKASRLDRGGVGAGRAGMDGMVRGRPSLAHLAVDRPRLRKCVARPLAVERPQPHPDLLPSFPACGRCR